MASAAWTTAKFGEWREARAARRREKIAAVPAAIDDMNIVGAELVEGSFELAPDPAMSSDINGFGDVDVPDLVETTELAETGELDGMPEGPVPATPSPSAAAVGIPPFPWKLPPLSMLKSASGGGVSRSELTATGELIVGKPSGNTQSTFRWTRSGSAPP